MDFLRGLFGGKKKMRVKVVDFRTDEERQIEEEARQGKSLGSKADRLVDELIKIGKTDYYLYSPDWYAAQWGKPQDKEQFDDDLHHIKAREIGRQLYETGGHNLMLAAYYRVIVELGSGPGSSLNLAWRFLGEWM